MWKLAGQDGVRGESAASLDAYPNSLCEECCCWFTVGCRCPGTVDALLSSDTAVVTTAAEILAASLDSMQLLCQRHLNGHCKFGRPFTTERGIKLMPQVYAAFPLGLPEGVPELFAEAKALPLPGVRD